MERYRKMRPVVLDQRAAPPAPFTRTPEVQSAYISPPTQPPSTLSYIRSPVPASARVFVPSATPVTQPAHPRRLRVALIGAPNAGKTSLMNSILKRVVGAVSSKINTTRESILGVLTDGDCQIEFVDCPGIVPRDGSSDARELSAEAWKTLNDSDCALLIVDTVKKPTNDFLETIRKISKKRTIVDELTEYNQQVSDGCRGAEDTCETQNGTTRDVILVLNKSDLVEDKKWLKVRNMQLSAHSTFDKTFYVSAKENHNVNNLVAYLKDQCVPGEWAYGTETVTTLSMTEQLEQLVRAFLFTWFNKDVPYHIQQQTVGWTERLDGTLIIEHELLVKDSVVARMILGSRHRLIQRLKENVTFKLKKNWGIEKLVLLIHVKAGRQRESKRDRIEKSKRSDLPSFLSRGQGVKR